MAEITLSVPTSLDDIQLWQYQEYLEVVDNGLYTCFGSRKGLRSA